MAQPIIALGGSTVTLPVPTMGGSNQRELQEIAVRRRTIGGRLRTTIMAASYAYQLAFRHVERTTYDALVTLWAAAADAGSYPTLQWSGGAYASLESPVSVGLEIGPAVPWQGDVTRCDFILTCTEELPR